MVQKVDQNPQTHDGVSVLDVYDRAYEVNKELIVELCETLGDNNPDKYKRIGYEMVAKYRKEPFNTGELTLVFASVLNDILYKLQMTQESENISMIRDEYSVMRTDN